MALNIKELIALADKLDEAGRYKEASKLDKMIQTLAAGKKLDIHSLLEEKQKEEEPERKTTRRKETKESKEEREDRERYERSLEEMRAQSIIPANPKRETKTVQKKQPMSEKDLMWELRRKLEEVKPEGYDKYIAQEAFNEGLNKLDWTETRKPSGAILKIIEQMRKAGWEVFAPGELSYWLKHQGYEQTKSPSETFEEEDMIKPKVKEKPVPGVIKPVAPLPLPVPPTVPQSPQPVSPVPQRVPIPVPPRPQSQQQTQKQPLSIEDIDKWLKEMGLESVTKKGSDMSMEKTSGDLPKYQPKGQEELIPGARERSTRDRVPVSTPILRAFRDFLANPQEEYTKLIKLIEDYKEQYPMPEKIDKEQIGISEGPLYPPQQEQPTISDEDAASEIARIEKEKGIVWASRAILEKLANIADRLDVMGASEEASLVDGFIEKYAEDFLKYQGENPETEQSKRYDSKYHHNIQIREPKGKQERVDRDGGEKHHVHTMQTAGASSLSTRYCPEHIGVSLGRVGELTYQCPLDGAVYNWEAGWTDYDGKEQAGGSVAAQTPDSSGYDTPHRIFDSRENILNRIN